MKTILKNHTSLETAYKVEDYPYGFRERTSIYYWIESAPKKGDRFCSVTVNPKTGNLNKPKKSTYSPFLYLYLDDINHVHAGSIDSYHTEQFAAKIQFAITDIGIDNISEVQQMNLRGEHYGHMRAGYGWILPKYSDERKPLFTAWMKAALKHIATAPFAEMANYPAAPEQDQPEESVKFTTSETIIIG